MTTIRILFVAVFGLMPALATAQTLVAREQASWDLAIHHDTAAYTALHAPEFIAVGPTGVTDRRTAESSALDTNVHFAHYALTDFHVARIAARTALVTYRVRASGLDHGKPFTLDSYVSSLWSKHGDTWLNLFYQSTPTGAH
jgi:hypothetical protein